MYVNVLKHTLVFLAVQQVIILNTLIRIQEKELKIDAMTIQIQELIFLETTVSTVKFNKTQKRISIILKPFLYFNTDN